MEKMNRNYVVCNCSARLGLLPHAQYVHDNNATPYDNNLHAVPIHIGKLHAKNYPIETYVRIVRSDFDGFYC